MPNTNAQRPSPAKDILLESGTNELEVLVFELGGQRFGVNVAKVREVILHVDAVPTPGQADTVKGVIRLRGSVLTVVDLHRQLGRAPKHPDENEWRIIVTEFNGTTAAFEVETVDSIYRLSWEDIRPVPDSGAKGHAEVTGMAEVGDELIMMLDFESIYDTITRRNAHLKDAAQNTLGVDRAACRVWLAEDSSFIRASIEKMLRESGFRDFTAHRNGLEAWQALAKEAAAGKTLPDVLISDIEMPQMDGLHLCKKVKDDKRTAGIKVVLYSSLITAETRHKGVNVGADQQYNKPKLEEVVHSIDRWMHEAEVAAQAPGGASDAA
ncbi:MAG: chemotaxis protein [Planctomycetota bacterium]